MTSSSTAPSAAPINLSAFTSDYSTVILSWDPVPKGHINGELLGHTVVVNGSDNILFAAPCFSSLELNVVNVSSDTCIRMAALTKVGIGPMANCAQIDFGKFSFCLCTAHRYRWFWRIFVRLLHCHQEYNQTKSLKIRSTD